MYLINTSFHIAAEKYHLLVETLKEELIPRAVASQILREPLLLDIMVDIDPELRSVSLQFRAKDPEEAMSALEEIAGPIISALTKECGGADKLLSFTTPMKVING